MTPTPEKSLAATQPAIEALLARFLGRQSAAAGSGFAAVLPGDVEPYEAVPIQAVDPKQAWDEATAVFAQFGEPSRAVKAPADWPTLVAAQPSHTGLAFAAGNFPQMVRDLAPLYRAAEALGDLAMADGPPVPVEVGPASNEFPNVLMKLGTLRLARQWNAAEALIAETADKVPAKWAAAWANETAAILWHRGRKAEAFKRWQAAPECVPVLFNRGMAALFSGQPADARNDLRRAVEQLPESSGWHHLGRLYLALAGG
jgi:tetratricopeptide (TPR) repeat protein